MSPTRCTRLPARPTGRGGFTLVELLVVIGIIAILAGVALGPITQGLEKAKESSGMQTARTLCLSMFQYQVDNGNFPGGNKSEDIAVALVQGGYITDPSIFAQDKGHAYAGTTANIQGGMTSTNICWDFIVETAVNASVVPNIPYGLSTSDPDSMPAIFSTGQNVAIPPQGPGGAVTLNSGNTNPFQNNGMAVCFKSNSAAFLKATNAGGTYTVNDKVANYLFNPSFSCTPGNYQQIKP